MAAVVSPNASMHEHQDLRSASKPFKRDREHSAKWIYGVRGGVLSQEELAEVPHNYRQRPNYKMSDEYRHGLHKTHANMQSGNSASGRANSRLARKADNKYESSSSATLSRSLIDLLPSPNTTQTLGASRSDDNSIMYSFDAVSSPGARGSVGLGALVEKAEKAFETKETERIVRKEWEILDEEGESTTVKKGGKKSPAVKAKKPELAIDEDGWECL